MRPARFFLPTVVALVVLIAGRPIAGGKQFPRGLMSSEPRAVGACTIETRPLNFGEYDTLAGTEVDAIGQVIYVCSNGNGPGTRAPSKGIRIDLTPGYSNVYAERHLQSFGVFLSYNIYLDATHRTIWGNGTNGTGAYIDEHPPNGRPVVVPVFGQIDARQDVPPGQYADVVLVRVIF